MSNFEFKEIVNNEDFNPSIISGEVSFTQAGFYGDWQKSLGRKVRRFLVLSDKEAVAYFQLVKYPLLLSKNYLYIPYGPVVKDFSKDFLAEFKKELKKIAKEENAVFVRLDFTPKVEDKIIKSLFTKAPLFTYHSAYFQPRLEWFLKINKTDETLLTEMHKNGRYSVKFAEKKDIKVEIVTKDFEKYFEIFYSLMVGTAERNGFSLHSKKYYENIFKSLSKIENSFLSVARLEDKILVVDLVIVFGKVAHYVFSGSSSEERNRMPTYLAIWEAIREARKCGCEYYNFGGISSDDKTYKGWDGLTSFKKKFGGEEVRHSDFYDLILNPLWYYLYNFRKFVKKFGF